MNYLFLSALFLSTPAFAETYVRYDDSTILQKLNSAELKIERGLQPSSVVLEITFGGASKASSAGVNLGGYQDVKTLKEDLLSSPSTMLIIVPRSGSGFTVREDRHSL